MRASIKKVQGEEFLKAAWADAQRSTYKDAGHNDGAQLQTPHRQHQVRKRPLCYAMACKGFTGGNCKKNLKDRHCGNEELLSFNSYLVNTCSEPGTLLRVKTQ